MRRPPPRGGDLGRSMRHGRAARRAGCRRRSCRRAPRRCSARSPGRGPSPSRRVVKNGSKIRGRSSGAMPAPRSMTAIRRRPVPAARRSTRIGRRRRRGRPRADGLLRVGEHVDEHRAQPLGVGDDRRGRSRHLDVTPARRRPRAGAACAASRQISTEVGRRELEPDRPGEVEDAGDDAVEPRALLRRCSSADVRRRPATGAGAGRARPT